MAGQTYPAREHIVIDGGSTDGTFVLLQAHRHQLAELVSEPDHGIYDVLNNGLARASGHVVRLLHADDLYADSAVLARIAAAFADPTVEAVYGDLVYVARQDSRRVIRYWRAGDYAPVRWRRGWMPLHPTLSLRRALSARRGMFDSRDQIAADHDLMLRMLTHLDGNGAGRVRYLPQVLVRMCLGGVSNRSPGHLLRKPWADDQALRPCKHYRGPSIRRRAAAPGSAGILPAPVRSTVCLPAIHRI